MGFYVIKGTFHVVNYSPDGDSIRFKADDSTKWNLLSGPAVTINGNEHAQLRMEAIDTLETHYGDLHQPLELALGALEFLLAELEITNVQWNAAHSRIVSANDGTRGYIIARAVEKNHRPISFVFAGEAPEPDWSSIELFADRLADSVNYKSVEAGLAYPTYYQGLFPDLRLALTQASNNARAGALGIWAQDKTNSGFSVPNLAAIENTHVIMPKLFRRLAGHLDGGGTVANFKDYLKSLNEGVTIISSTHFTHFDNVVEVAGNVVQMTQPPENLIFAEG
jgi:endonuclease YncB( thermonuclease family)